MKTSNVLLILITLNSSALLLTTIIQLIRGINPWLFISLEILLIIGYLFNMVLKKVKATLDFNCNYLNLYTGKLEK